MVKPFLNAAVIGNGRILAAISSRGEMHRLFWPHIDMAQQVNRLWPAVLSPIWGDRAVRLDDERHWTHAQEYIGETNILKTMAGAKNKKLRVTTVDFVLPDSDTVVRSFEFSNVSSSPFPAVFIYYASLYLDDSNLYNTNYFEPSFDILFHYRRNTWVALAGSLAPTAFQCGCASEDALSGRLNGNRIAMAASGCQLWDLGVLEPGRSMTVVVYLAAGNSREQVLENVISARKCGWDSLRQETAAFWETYLQQGYLPAGISEEIKQLYRRSIMVSKLLMNKDTGGIIAAPEFDESCTRCGGYAYCWTRDATFVAHAMLKAGYPGYARAFYRWAAHHQNPAGGWPQRQYTNGQLAPGWGDQIDETGTVLWGMSRYFKETWDPGLAEEIWPAVVKAAEFLLANLDEETGLPRMSHDLWEERFGEHAYSAAAVSAGLRGAGRIAGTLGETELAGQWLEASAALRERILDYFRDPDLNRFIRSGWITVDLPEYENRKNIGEPVRTVTGPKGYERYEVFGDSSPDSSLLGLTVPFGIIPASDPRIRETVRHLVRSLTNQGPGGIKRYHQDCYIGGNPWIVTTLWVGAFEAAAGDWEAAAGRLEWALKHKTPLGFLPEQIDRKTGQTAWVVPLSWSHAMFILLVQMISDAQKRARLSLTSTP